MSGFGGGVMRMKKTLRTECSGSVARGVGRTLFQKP